MVLCQRYFVAKMCEWKIIESNLRTFKQAFPTLHRIPLRDL